MARRNLSHESDCRVALQNQDCEAKHMQHLIPCLLLVGPESPQGLVNNIQVYQGERFDTEAEEKQTRSVMEEIAIRAEKGDKSCKRSQIRVIGWVWERQRGQVCLGMGWDA